MQGKCSTCGKAVLNRSLLKLSLASFQHLYFFCSSKFGFNGEGVKYILKIRSSFITCNLYTGILCFSIFTRDVTATAHLDYEPLDANLTFPDFLPLNQYIIVSIFDDDVIEGAEVLEVVFELYEYDPFLGKRPIADPAITRVLIVDDDAPRKYSNKEIYSRYNS